MINQLYYIFLFWFSLYCFITCSAADIKNISTDESSLLAFKSLITSDPHGMLANNWSTSSSVCNWVGITCDNKHNRVHSLNLTNMGLRGTLSPNLGNLSFLVILDLSNNRFGGMFPNEVCRLRRLKVLDFGFNDFVGEIPMALGELSQLQQLNLSINHFSGFIPPSLCNLSKLENFNFGKNSLEGTIPPVIGQLGRLKRLILTYNKLSGFIPKEISNISSLQGLFVGSNYFSGPIPEEIGYLGQLEYLILAYNNFSGSIPSNFLNKSSLTNLQIEHNSLSGIIPSNMNLPSIVTIHLYHNNFVGNIPASIFNFSNLIQLDLGENAFSGTLPNNAFANLRYLKYLVLSSNHILPNLPKSIGNITSVAFVVDFCGIYGNIPLEIGNMSNLIALSMVGNNINGPIPRTLKGLQKLQRLGLSNNGLHGSFIDELCEMRSLIELYLYNTMLSGVLPTCLGNMTFLEHLDLGYNNLNSKIPSSLWSLTDILEINLTTNAFTGNLPLEIGNLRAIVLLDISRNLISGNIPTTITFLKTVENISLAHNNLQGSIPSSLGDMVGLISLDLSQNMLTGVIPKSLTSLLYLQNINFSYNSLQGEIPDGGLFKTLTAQSFIHNEALCGNPRLQVPLCAKQVRKISRKKKLLLKCTIPLVLLTVFVVACIILIKHKSKKVENNLEKGLSTLGGQRRISYYELVQATNGFNEGNLLGKGGFGSVYQGKLLDECNSMRNLRHRNLVKIISSCSNLDFKSLVMEFMSNGSVDKWLYSYNYCLNFLQRLNIMIDVASALEYLHHGSPIPVVHCDLKPTNVLLDENMVAHVSDFGIAKLMDEGQSKTHTNTLATIGYLAPEYGSEGIVSVKGDVYSYGIMLMEIFTRRKPTDDMFIGDLSLKTWIGESLSDSILEVLDSNLVQQNGEQMDDILTHMSSIFGLALNCCEHSPGARINMADVKATLIKIKTLIFGRSAI
ncbi:unnamed protein product [Vicia faba]|uniref:non-specific serine/threonine protein kinase n=1 Tax=Vicia faba TaxID=3906 RepID=A0AAV1ACZ6_VICFA|nr:unnamed protein product [Vicia faba]